MKIIYLNDEEYLEGSDCYIYFIEKNEDFLKVKEIEDKYKINVNSFNLIDVYSSIDKFNKNVFFEFIFYNKLLFYFVICFYYSFNYFNFIASRK